MQVTAKGQITIIDTNDGRALSALLSANHPTTQIFTSGISDTYTPNYAAEGNALIIKPELYASGFTSNQIALCRNFRWYVNGDEISSYNETFGAVAEDYNIAGKTLPNGQLKITKNMISSALMTIECSFEFVDPDTNLPTATKAILQFVKVNNAGDSICAVMYAPFGDTVRTEFGADQSGNANVSDSLDCVTLRCDMWRGSAIDNTNVQHRWYRMTGEGDWVQIIPLEYKFNITSSDPAHPDCHDTLVVGADAIDNFLMIKCDIEDTDEASATAHKVATDTITIYDATDPYSVQIEASGGDRLTTTTTSTVLKATVWNNGVPMGDAFHRDFVSYYWNKLDKDGNDDDAWKEEKEDGVLVNANNISRTIKVTKAMVYSRAVFTCVCKIGYQMRSKLEPIKKADQEVSQRPTVAPQPLM